MTDAPQPYRIRSPLTWAAARAAYLEGEAAESVCARFDLGLSAFRRRAREEGWRRADQPDPPETNPDDADPDGDEDFDPMDLASLAWRRAGRAMVRGRSAEAARWLRLHETLIASERARERHAAQAEGRRDRAERDLDDAHLRAITLAERRLALDAAGPRSSGRSVQAEVHDLHDAHPVPAARPANRAERRRLARMERAGASP